MTLLDVHGNEIKPKADPIITDLKALRKKSIPTKWEYIEKINLIDRLRASNETAWTKGVGLAAMQIGVYSRVVWFKDDEKEYVLVNPTIIDYSEPVVNPKEGCLSMPDVWTMVKRFYKITVRHLGKEGWETIDFKGFNATVVQHEIDHMNGVLNIDRRYIPPQKVGRNDPCPCGSKIKYKKCCIDKIDQTFKQEYPAKGDTNNGK